MTDPTADAAKLLPCHGNEWHPIGEGTPLNVWLETKREGENGTNVCFCRLLVLGDEPEWVEQPPHGRTTITHHTFAAPTHWRWNTRPYPAPPVGEPLSDAQIRHMVDRFLGWQLPKPWTPDNGISYVRPNYMHPPADHDWPTGTNLFDWAQAEAMVRYMIEGIPCLAARSKVEDAEVAWACKWLRSWLIGSRRIKIDGDDAEAFSKWANLLERLSADLRTKETQLARADATIEALSLDMPLPDERDIIDALERHKYRQPAAKDNGQ